MNMNEPEERTHVPHFTFGDRLRKVRTEARYDQREFARMIGLTSSTVAAYETGRANPKFKDANSLAQRIEEATGVPAWWMLDVRTGDESPLSDSNRRPPLYIVDGRDDWEWPAEAVKQKQVA